MSAINRKIGGAEIIQEKEEYGGTVKLTDAKV